MNLAKLFLICDYDWSHCCSQIKEDLFIYLLRESQMIILIESEKVLLPF